MDGSALTKSPAAISPDLTQPKLKSEEPAPEDMAGPVKVGV